MKTALIISFALPAGAVVLAAMTLLSCKTKPKPRRVPFVILVEDGGDEPIPKKEEK